MRTGDHSIQGATRAGDWARRAIAVVVALALCMWLVPHAAWGDDDADEFDVALTIVDTTDAESGVIYNDVVTVSDGDTVADMLAAAGFSAAESAEATLEDDTLYYDSWDSPTFRGNVTTQDSDGNWVYWCSMYEGDSANYASAALSATLVENGHYQYIYGSDSTFTYTDEADTFSVQLTIVDTTDADDGVLANTEVSGMTDEDTVADMLAAAGFSAAESADATLEDDTLYYDSWDSPTFRGNVTTQDSDGNWVYWCSMYEGDSANYASAALSATLQACGHYQYIYGSSSTFAYDDDVTLLVGQAVNNPLSASPSEDADDEDDADADDDESAAYDAEATATLLANLTERFSDGGSDEAISNSTVSAAIALGALGLGSDIDAEAIMANLEAYESTYGTSIGAGTLAKYIMALTAAGIDCTAATSSDGQTVDLLAQMEELAAASEPDAYSLVYILAVYDYGGYEPGEDALSADELVALLLACIDDDGLVGAYGYSDTQTTAQAILALLPYAEDDDVSAALEQCAAALLAYQNDDGGFGYASYSTDSNLDATAAIVAALVALGYTDEAYEATAWLVSEADDTLDGYEDNDGSYDEAMTSSTVLLALAAIAGYEATDTAYDVYTVASSATADDTDASADTDDDDDASADDEADETDTSAADDDDASATADDDESTASVDDEDTSATSDDESTTSSSESSSTSTGDDALFVTGAGALAIAALAASACARRKRLGMK